MSNIEDRKINMVEILRNNLEHRVKKAITEDLVRPMVAEFEARLRMVANEALNDYVFKDIQGISDMLNMRDELHVFVNRKEIGATKLNK